MPPELSGDRLAFDMLSFATAGKRVPSVSVGIKAMHLICMVDKRPTVRISGNQHHKNSVFITDGQTLFCNDTRLKNLGYVSLLQDKEKENGT